MGCVWHPHPQLLETFIYPNQFFGWNNCYKGSKQTVHLIINVGAINQPYPLPSQDCSPGIQVLFGIELASFNREIVDTQGNEHEPRSLISSSFNLACLGHYFGSALKSHYAIKDCHTFLADLDKLGDD